MKRSATVEAIILNKKKYHEADKLITLLSKYHGKIICLAKGARKIKSKKSPHLEVFNLIRGHIIFTRTWALITEVETLQNFTALRNNLHRVAYAYKIAEVTSRLCPEGETYLNIYLKLRQVYHQLNDTAIDNSSLLTYNYLTILLIYLGYISPTQNIDDKQLNKMIEYIIEGKIKSDTLLTKLN